MAVKTLTTTNEQQSTVPVSLKAALRDYKLHYSSSDATIEPECNLTSSFILNTQNPPNWPTRYRRIPPYRPINRNLDLSERPNGSNRGELLFVTVVMNGVRLQAVSLKQMV